MKPYLQTITTLSDGLYEAILRDYVANNLHNKISMDGYVKEVLRFTVDTSGNIVRENKWTKQESIQVHEGLFRIARELFIGIDGLQHIDLGFIECIADTLYFHVFDASFDQRISKWQ